MARRKRLCILIDFVNEYSVDSPQNAPLPVWNPPTIEHQILDADEGRRYPQRTRHPPDYFHY